MTIKHVRGTQEDAYWTSLTAYLTTTYDNLVESFGPPNYGPNGDQKDKSTCEWILKFGDEVITIYDWKQYQTPMGVYRWHVGSKGPIRTGGLTKFPDLEIATLTRYYGDDTPHGVRKKSPQPD